MAKKKDANENQPASDGTQTGEPVSSELLDLDAGTSVADAGHDEPGADPEGNTNLQVRAGAHVSNTDSRASSTVDKTPLDMNVDDVLPDSLVMPEGFDPSIHALGPDNMPKIKADGTFAKKRGRKPAGVSATTNFRETPEASQNDPQNTPQEKPNPSSVPVAPVNHKIISQQYAALFFAFGYMVGGDEWKPDDKDEQKIVEGAIFEYVKASEIEAMSPGLGLVLTLGMYSLKRAQREKTRSKLQALKDKISLGLAWIKARRSGGK